MAPPTPPEPAPPERRPSPLTPEVVAAGRISFSGLQVEAGALWWSESRPSEGGRQVVMRWAGPVGPVEVSPPAVSVRSRVQEYGGAAFWVSPAGRLVYSEITGGGLWEVDPGGEPVRLTPEPPAGEEVRYGDVRGVPGLDALVAVREWHRGGEVGEVENAVVLVSEGSVQVLAGGRDFFAAPRPSPDGRWLAFLAWDQPEMPWDGSELLVRPLVGAAGGLQVNAGPLTRVAGGRAISIGQPRWSPGGELWFLSDEGGWWQPWRCRPGAGPGAEAERVCAVEAEFHSPDWVLGQSTGGFLADGRLVTRYRAGGRDRVGIVDPARGSLVEVEQPCVSIAALAVDPGVGGAGEGVVLLGATVDAPAGIHRLALDGGEARVVHRPGPVLLAPEEVSVAEAGVAPGRGGGEIPYLFYPPSGPAGEGELPPVLVVCHGGPTGAVEGGFDPAVQFWTSRGVAVAAVDYRGSAGYGRAYRGLLAGAWGVADAEDVADVALALAEGGRVDGKRMAVRGASSGGLTALRAATVGGPFGAVISAYGVTDLRALAADTHKFEARYLDGLVGPWPEAEAVYEERSPACHPELIGAAVLLLQGEEDAVVPPDQARRMAAALEARGVRCELVLFPGEGHGFRRGETLAECTRREQAFLGEVLGFPAS